MLAKVPGITRAAWAALLGVLAGGVIAEMAFVDRTRYGDLLMWVGLGTWLAGVANLVAPIVVERRPHLKRAASRTVAAVTVIAGLLTALGMFRFLS